MFSVDSSHILLFAQEAFPILPSYNLLNGMFLLLPIVALYSVAIIDLVRRESVVLHCT